MTSPITPEHIAARSHIAVALRQYLDMHGLSVADFNTRMLHVDADNTRAYGWLAGRCVPVGANVVTMAKILGQPREFFLPRAPAAQSNGTNAGSDAVVTDATTPTIVQARNPRTIRRERDRSSRQTTPALLTVEAHANGTASITVHYTGPADKIVLLMAAVAKLGIGAPK